MSQVKNPRAVFVGNIPYELTEEQLIDIFKEVGPVVSFRLVFDRETGRPKGYGFCEFLDAETASSAVRNLNNYDVGGRQLRVDYTENDATSNAAGRDGDGFHNSNDPRLSASQSVPSTESVSNTISNMNTNQLAELMSQMKSFAQQSPEQARSVLTKNPQLAYGIFQAMVAMNLVDHHVLQRLLNQLPGQATNVPTPVAPAFPGPADNTSLPVPSKAPPPSSTSTGIPGAIGGNANPAMSDHLQEQQRVLLMQLLNLTPQQIDSLPPEQRQHILQLKAQIMMGQGQT
ncbi:hypothetical protein K493DRAFT_79620 [Basidiobolus meristosporus CBS 931.73]|uniref:RRM domain-containing protein n=1 Tax=Basidiobolus meristosporus CBS 931.73 TaxID=1314790 RepID=A0A1Y1YXE9_9FUNG|nr:hypothetical protein K493DRAFT_79620 [Basidiobolus meristosporus CBS 931.73]|eukprot:ORY02712.1 hypothetical protein K493DRAFT_79620 [Basidiobolus meristosporus CBS 931.73]